MRDCTSRPRRRRSPVRGSRCSRAIKRLTRRYDARVLEQLTYLPALPADAFAQPQLLREWTRELNRTLNLLNDGSRSYVIDVQATPDLTGADAASGEGIDAAREGLRPPRIVIRRQEHGTSTDKYLTRDFFVSAEYARIADLGRTLQGLIGEGAFVTSGGQRREIGSFKEAINWLFDQARKGQTMQRYKGLGEMNPEQLWDTTINPETRRLLQVRIEDAVTADDIFTTLMGDQVEPRREFIEKNALAVSNLDI